MLARSTRRTAVASVLRSVHERDHPLRARSGPAGTRPPVPGLTPNSTGSGRPVRRSPADRTPCRRSASVRPSVLVAASSATNSVDPVRVRRDLLGLAPMASLLSLREEVVDRDLELVHVLARRARPAGAGRRTRGRGSASRRARVCCDASSAPPASSSVRGHQLLVDRDALALRRLLEQLVLHQLASRPAARPGRACAAARIFSASGSLRSTMSSCCWTWSREIDRVADDGGRTDLASGPVPQPASDQRVTAAPSSATNGRFSTVLTNGYPLTTG